LNSTCEVFGLRDCDGVSLALQLDIFPACRPRSPVAHTEIKRFHLKVIEYLLEIDETDSGM